MIVKSSKVRSQAFSNMKINKAKRVWLLLNHGRCGIDTNETLNNLPILL